MHGILLLGPIGEYRHEEQRTSVSVFVSVCFVERGNNNDDDTVFVFSPGDVCICAVGDDFIVAVIASPSMTEVVSFQAEVLSLSLLMGVIGS